MNNIRRFLLFAVNNGAPITWAALLAGYPASGYPNALATVSDYGAPYLTLISDGVSWLPVSPQILFRGAIPVGLAPSGSIGNNGALTLGTALPAIYPACYLHFPLNAIVAGSAAGLYYTVMSSTTVGTVYNNTYTSGIPAAPASPTAFATAAPPAFTAVVTRQTLITLTLPGGLTGLNGATEMESMWSATNNANAKTGFVSFGGNDLSTGALASVSSMHDSRLIVNRASAAIQIAQAASATGGAGGAAAASTYLAVNTAADVTLTWAATKGTATDWMGIEWFRVKASG